MYKYPNGLECNVSEARVKAFEMLVPPLALVLCAGFAFAAWLLFDPAAVLRSFLLFMTAATIWCAACALAAYRVFYFWCKPVFPAPGSEDLSTK